MKLNILVDISGIFYRTLFTIGSFGAKKGEKLLDSKRSQGVFIRKLATDLSSLIRTLDVNPNRVIICVDSSSWRKSIEIEEGGYKSGREEKKNQDVNWTAFFELTEKFINILSQKGYLISKVPGAEADDLLFFWSRKLNNMNENVIIITGDRDLLQVLGLHKNNSWTIALDPVNNRKKISLTQEVLDRKSEVSLVEPDIFNPDSWSSSEDALEKLINSHEINIVDIRKLCVMKVIMGDGGDSVPSVVSWPDKKEPEKIRTMTENNYSKILAAVPELETANWKQLREGKFFEEISSIMEGLKKITVDRDLVKRNLERNCRLVILSTETIPEQIVDNFKSLHAEVPEMIAVTNRDSLLAGSEWWSSDNNNFIPKSYDLFGEE